MGRRGSASIYHFRKRQEEKRRLSRQDECAYIIYCKQSNKELITPNQSLQGRGASWDLIEHRQAPQQGIIILSNSFARPLAKQRKKYIPMTANVDANIYLQDGHFSLIHIPLPLYAYLLQPILRVLLPHDIPIPKSLETPEQLVNGVSIHDKHGFLNISVTPVECSVVCHAEWANSVFQPAIDRLPKELQKQVTISRESYMVFSVSSAGMEAGQRVMDLTAPLAMAGISIFFITTYYTDFILVPSKDHKTVVKALLARGFEFSESDSAYVAPTAVSHSRGASSSSDPPSTPPPSNVAELQARTFNQLRKRNVVPFIEDDLHLIQCSGKEISSNGNYSSRPSSNGSNGKYGRSTWLNNVDPKLYMSIVAALTIQPRFLSVTLAKDDAPSLLIDKTLLYLFGNSIAGDRESDLVPIFLDLSSLPLESTGIVCGVAGRLVDETRMHGSEGGELSYLSTVRAGAVILSCEGSAMALKTLVPLLEST